jgi:hypothetical protein
MNIMITPFRNMTPLGPFIPEHGGSRPRKLQRIDTLFMPEYGGTLLRNACKLLPDYMVSSQKTIFSIVTAVRGSNIS